MEGHARGDAESLTPVAAASGPNIAATCWKLSGSLQTIVCLRCDRCLGRFNQQLEAESKELIWLGDQPIPMLAAEGLGSRHPGWPDGKPGSRSSFEPERWVFEQLSLQMSVVNRCGDDCPGLRKPCPQDREAATEVSVDPRWQALQDLQSSLQTDGGDHGDTWIGQLDLLIRSGTPLIWIRSHEEERVEGLLTQTCERLPDRTLASWDFVGGLSGVLGQEQLGARQPMAVLQWLQGRPSSNPTLLLLKDVHRFCDDPGIARMLRNLSGQLRTIPTP